MEKVRATSGVRLPAKATIWNIFSAALARGVGAIGTPIFTRLLAPSEYGLYPLYTTWLGVVSALATLGLAGGVIYRGLQRYDSERGRFISSAMGLFFTIFLTLGSLIMLLSGVIERVTGLSPLILAMLLSEVLFSTIIAFSSARARYEYKYRSQAAINIISALGSPLIAILLILYTPYHSEARILGSIITSLFIALPQLYLMLARCEKLYDREIWGYLLKMALPFLPHLISSSLIVRVGEMVIARSHGDGALGKYSVAMSLGLALSIISGGVGQVLSPWLLRKLGQGRFDTVREVVGSAIRVMAIGGVLLSLIAPELMIILTPPEYRDVLPAVYPLIIASIFFFISQTAMSAEMYYERPMRAAFPTVLVAFVTVATAILFIPEMDYRLTSLITLGAYIMTTLLNLANFKSVSGEKMLHGLPLVRDLLFLVVFVTISFFFRDVWLSRLLFALALLPVVINNGYQVYKIIKE